MCVHWIRVGLAFVESLSREGMREFMDFPLVSSCKNYTLIQFVSDQLPQNDPLNVPLGLLVNIGLVYAEIE